MVKKGKNNSLIFDSHAKNFMWFALFLVALSVVALVANTPSNAPQVTGQAFKNLENGVQIAYWGYSDNYPLNLGQDTIQTEVIISASTVNSLAAGYLVQDIAALITGSAGIGGDVKTLLGGLVPDPVSAALILSDKFVNYFRSSASKCLKQVAIYYGSEAHFVIASTAELERSNVWGGNYVYAKTTYYSMSGNYICSERSCAGFVYDSGATTTSCW